MTVHLDSASMGRSSFAVLDAVAAHGRREAETGGYVAEAAAADRLAALHDDLGVLTGTDAAGVALTESATTALLAALRAWPWRPGAVVGVAPHSWGPNLEALAGVGLTVEPLPADEGGTLDLASLDRRLARTRLDAVLVDLVAAHSGLVQPVADVAAVLARHDVPLWVDAAQGLGHVAVPRGPAVVFATGRKWLRGPRGVGLLAVAAGHRDALRVPRPRSAPDATALALLESADAHVAGRLGLGVAVAALRDAGPEVVSDRLVEVGAQVRAAVADLGGWTVVDPVGGSAITSLRPTRGQDVDAVRRRLLDRGFLVTATRPWRAPYDERLARDGGWLRVSPHVDVTTDDLARLARTLAEVG